jgi:hypothetical protein
MEQYGYSSARGKFYTDIHRIAALSMLRLPLSTDFVHAGPSLRKLPRSGACGFFPWVFAGIDFQTKSRQLALGIAY